MLMRRPGIAVTYMIFDLLGLDGRSLLDEPYVKRRSELEALDLEDVGWQTPETLDDGDALFEAVCAHGIEGLRRSGGQAATSQASAAG
jgi:bifunctional non-homologous end joining protein LigD